jgi:hypothetical protein
VQAGGVDVVRGEVTFGDAAKLKRPVDRPRRMVGVVDRYEKLSIQSPLQSCGFRRTFCPEIPCPAYRSPTI